jgi:hypothetical protein
MKRLAVSALALAALATPSLAADCAKDYKDFWDNNSPLAKNLTPQQYAALSRTALRGFDACSAGDERFADDFFKKLGRPLPSPRTSGIRSILRLLRSRSRLVAR